MIAYPSARRLVGAVARAFANASENERNRAIDKKLFVVFIAVFTSIATTLYIAWDMQRKKKQEGDSEE